MQKDFAHLGRTGLACLAVAMACGFIFPKRYPELEAGTPAAMLILVKAESKSIHQTTQYFHLFENSDCNGKAPRSGFLAALQPPSTGLTKILVKTKQRIEIPVVAGAPVYLHAKSVDVLDSRRRSFTTNNCTNLVSFTPVEGRAYEAIQLQNDKLCLLMVMDVETKRIPDDFKPVPISGACHGD